MGIEESETKTEGSSAERITLPPDTEFETKYKIEDGGKVHEFKRIVEVLPDLIEFVYAQGPDEYFTKPVKEDDSFFRYRKAENDSKSWITMKGKTTDKNNFNRREFNWRVDGTPYETIKGGIEYLGYKFNFKVWKSCHIYRFPDATLVFYTLRDEKEDLHHFCEIEVDEHSIHTLTEDEAWEIIRKYEKELEPLGITHRNRTSKSLFEMFRRPNDQI